MGARRSSFFVGSAVVAVVSAIAASSPAAPADATEPSVLPAPGDHNLTKCSGTKKLCGLQGDNICCDGETECCVRKPHRTVCVRKKDKC